MKVRKIEICTEKDFVRPHTAIGGLDIKTEANLPQPCRSDKLFKKVNLIPWTWVLASNIWLMEIKPHRWKMVAQVVKTNEVPQKKKII